MIDSDLDRGTTAGECVRQTVGATGIFNGFPTVIRGENGGFQSVTGNGEVSMDITFKDGTSLSGVSGLYDAPSFACGPDISINIFDQYALASVGKSVAAIASVDSRTFVDHDLSWADLGFIATGITVPGPEPEPVHPARR